ncbi:MAG TPA: maleylpyruvate isomerase family mycothiol-dependent enzyme [Stackebrandtia sp.]|jgi:uncharacterized protein (TIGR03083 family)|uniref:maleylpyruvate isomerase family mycothiol-dependent enzyme n=1 Tax=Stackebrandtia sp. TaxID=2023065 RepID=UPI002D6CD45C|nr:maleylpyruvate isomerase family mycothiol-dependent enzyme [Stackebrandtia sp.]HZE41478.1 maleylpyruvate isomerase family mycothiol-dependent enzyme [Stackebrandtia sp.]
MDFNRHCIEIVHQTELLTHDVSGADLRAPVPSCPDWTLGMLLRHIGFGHRWAEETVRTRSVEMLPDDKLRKLDGDDSTPPPLDWLMRGARRYADTLLEAGPGSPAWGPFDDKTAAFLARRFANETLMHRADATLAAGTPFVASAEAAVEGIDEWMDLDVVPLHFAINPARRELLGPGRTIAFDATDTDASWFLDLTGDLITWRRGPGDAAVRLRGPVTDLLLRIYQRRSIEESAIEVTGDTALLELWTRHVTFG